MLKKLSEFGWGYILMALLTTAIGVCFFAFKDSLSYLALAVGILVILLAAFLGLLALADKSRGASFFFKLVFAVVTLAAGVTTLIARDTAISVIIGIFGLVLIMDGSFKFHTAAMSKKIFAFRLVVYCRAFSFDNRRRIYNRQSSSRRYIDDYVFPWRVAYC